MSEQIEENENQPDQLDLNPAPEERIKIVSKQPGYEGVVYYKDDWDRFMVQLALDALAETLRDDEIKRKVSEKFLQTVKNNQR